MARGMKLPMIGSGGWVLSSFSHTRRMTVQQCPRKYYLRYEAGIEPKYLPKPLRMGSAYSDALEHRDPEVAREYYRKLLIDYPHEMFESLREEAIIVSALATTYLALYAGEQDKWLREYPFGPLQLPGNQADNGFFDGVWSDGNVIHLLENKCKSRFMPSDEVALEWDPQVTGYVAALVAITGVPAEKIAVTYDVAIKPALRQTQKEDREGFLRRLESDIIERGAKQHKRFHLSRTTDQITEFNEDLDNLAQGMADLRAKERWAKHLFACSNYGGCEYIKLCHSPDSDAGDIINAHYNIKEIT